MTVSLCAGEPAYSRPERPDQTYLIDTWGTEQGLPDSSVTAMVQTADGYLWLGTFAGLVRFDGVKFTVFDTTNTPGLPSEGIVNLHLDRSGRLWVSTLKGMAVRSETGWRTLGEAEGWKGNFARSFSERGNGDLLITTFDGNLLQVAGDRVTSVPAPLLPGHPQPGYVAALDSEGRWWVVQGGYIGYWDGRQWVQSEPRSALPLDQVGCAPGRDGTHWALLGESLRQYRGGQEIQRVSLTEPLRNVWSLSEDSRGNVWVCSSENGVRRISPRGEVHTWDSSNGLAHNGVRFAFEDRERNVWIGSGGGGLTRFKPRRVRHYGGETGLMVQTVSSVSPSDGGLWIATYGKGLHRMRDGVATAVPLERDKGPANYLQSVLCDRAGRTWVGTYAGGLFLISGSGARAIPVTQTGGGNIIALFEDSRGDIWASGGDGVGRSDGSDFRPYAPEQAGAGRGVCCFAEGLDGTIWVSNLAGVFRLMDDQFHEVTAPGGAPILDVECIRIETDGTAWMGSRRAGLLRWRPDRLDRVGADQGFPAKSVHGILEDQRGFWWMATGTGVVRAERRQLEAAADGTIARLTCQVLDKLDGMASAECTGGRQPVCGRDAHGVMWFATSKGVVSIDPEAFAINAEPPQTHIEELLFERAERRSGRLRSEPPAERIDLLGLAAGGERLTLPAGSRQFHIRYTATSFAAPERVRFQTILEGRDASWRAQENQREELYRSLPPGDYAFRVRAANNDGIWNEAGSRLAFTVLPFYWQTLWFRIGGTVLLVLSAAGAVWWAVRASRRRALQSGERIRLVFESVPNGLVMVDEGGRIVMANAMAERYFGYSRPELIGQSVEVLLPERFAGGHAALRRGYLADPTARSMGVGRDLFGRRKDGTEFPVEIGLTPIRTPQGLTVLASIIDITERKRVELEAVQQRNELAHLSRVNMLGELSGSLAHELNQPLTAILSNAQAAQRLLSRETVDLGELREILTDIVGEDKRAGEVIHRLRQLLKKGEVEQTVLDVGEVVREVLKLVRSDVINHGVTLRADLAPDLPMVLADRVQLQQVLVNLVINACEAMDAIPSAARRLLVKARAEGDEHVQVSVSDSGLGIAPEHMDRMFQPFFTTKPTGMGLGLAVCRTIISTNGGKLWAANNAGRGATLHFTLPTLKEPAG